MKQSHTIGESRAISHLDDTKQQAQQVAEILHYQPRLLRRTPTKIHHERRRRRQQEAARKAQTTSLSTARATRQHSDRKHVQRQRQNTTITLQIFRLQVLLHLLLKNHPK